MESLIFFAIVIEALVFILILVFEGKSISGCLFLNDVSSVAEIAAGVSLIDAQVDLGGRIKIKLCGTRGLTKIYVRRNGEIMSGVTFCRTCLPKSRSFAFQSSREELSEEPHITHETLSHIRSLIVSTRQSKELLAASGNQISTWLFRYHVGFDQSKSERELNSLHNFVLEDIKSDQSYHSISDTSAIKWASLIVDLSDGNTDLLFCHTTTTAEVYLNNDLSKKVLLKRAI